MVVEYGYRGGKAGAFGANDWDGVPAEEDEGV